MAYVELADLCPLPSDVARIQKYGKIGCPILRSDGSLEWATGTDAPFVTTTRFSPQPFSTRTDPKTRLRLQGQLNNLESKINEMRTLKDTAVKALGAYIASSDGEDANFAQGMDAIRCMGDRRIGVYADVAELILFAPDADAAGKACGQKLEVEARWNALWAPLAPILSKVQETGKSRAFWASIRAWISGLWNTIKDLAEAFIEALKRLLSVLMSIFSFLGGHPRLVIYGMLGLLGLAGAGFGWWQFKKFRAIAGA
jgi:hypothetical protein